MNVPFVELDKEIERSTGMPISEIFALYGQSGYRRIEKQTLERVLQDNAEGVISVGGGIVARQDAYDYLLSCCFTVWIKAQPEEHMARVIAQGDLRPMAGNDEAMDDLKRILEAREPLYSRADETIDTSGEEVDISFSRLRQMVTN